MCALPQWQIIVVCSLLARHQWNIVSSLSYPFSYPRKTLQSKMSWWWWWRWRWKCLMTMMTCGLPQWLIIVVYSQQRASSMIYRSTPSGTINNKGIVYHFPLRHQRDLGMKIPQLLPQLQTPEKNVGASPIDALMPASTEGLQWWPGGWLVRHKRN